jgi:hypothetical protein
VQGSVVYVSVDAIMLSSNLNHTQNFTSAWDGIKDSESGVIEYEVGIFSLSGANGTYMNTQEVLNSAHPLCTVEHLL